MEANRLFNTNKIPLLLAGRQGRRYLELDEHGYLQYYVYKDADGCWNFASDNAFHQEICGFDSTVDKADNAHLFGYDRRGNLLYLQLLPQNIPEKTELLGHDESRQIRHLSSAVDNFNHLHLFYLAANEEKEMWWLFYLCREDGKWLEKVVLDFGYFRLEQRGIIFSDFSNNLFLLHRLYEKNGYSLILRSFEREAGLPGKTFYLEGKEKNCFYPDALVAADNALHISWISCENKIMFLNYARKSPDGKWGNYLCTEISQGSSNLAPLYLVKDTLVLTWENNNALFFLVSRDGGKRWKWGTKKELGANNRMARFRREPYPLKEPSWRGNYTFTSTTGPPETYLEPKELLDIQPEEGSVSGELQVLELLSSRIFTGYGNLQESNKYLKQKVERQKKELTELYSTNLAKTKTLQEKLTSRNMEIDRMKNIFHNTLSELKVKINREKEELLSEKEKLQQKIKALKNENEEQKKNNLLLSREISGLKEEISSLKKDNEKLQKSGIHFLFKRLKFMKKKQ